MDSSSRFDMDRIKSMEKVEVPTKVVENSGQFTEGHEKIGGRVKGSLNKETKLKNEILDILETRKEELKDVAIIDLLRIGAMFVPKKTQIEADIQHEIQHMGRVKKDGKEVEHKVGDV